MKRQQIITLFQTLGRASLELGLQNSHSGNLAYLWRGRGGEDFIAITRSGSQKGDLKPGDIIFLRPKSRKVMDASTEFIVHREILRLPGAKASFHTHAPELTLMSLAEAKKTAQTNLFVPLDALGIVHLKGGIPVIRVKRAFGSPELAAAVTKYLREFPVVAVEAHGLFSRGQELVESFFYANIANFSARVVRLLYQMKGRVKEGRKEIKERNGAAFFVPPAPYKPPELEAERRQLKKELIQAVDQIRNRLWASQLSPFYTGSLSLKEESQKGTILYVSSASTLKELGDPLRRFPIDSNPADAEELNWHRRIYEKTGAVAIIRGYIAEAEAAAWDLLGQSQDLIYFRPLDVEGQFLHPRLPILPSFVDKDTFLACLRAHQVVIVRGGGVWAISPDSLSQALHRVASVKDSCFYYVGLKELGCELR